MEPSKASNQDTFIERVRLQGYKSIEDVEVTFKPGMNILIGANGSGKTNFVRFLELILKRNYNTTTVSINGKVDYWLKGEKYSYSFIRPRIFSPNTLVDFEETVLKDGENIINSDDAFKEWHSEWTEWLYPNIVLYGVSENFSNINNLEKINLIKTPIDLPGLPFYWLFIEPEVTEGIHGLIEKITSYLSNSNLSSDNTETPQLPREFIENLMAYTPVKDMRLTPNYRVENIKIGKEILHARFEFLVDGKWRPWTHLSDGTKRLVYIITEVTFSNNIILLEEPELGIHPHQLFKLMQFLEAESEHKQIILTTHSPQVLNALRMDELDRIIVVNYDKENGTKMSHLSEEEQQHARNYMETEGLYLSDYWIHSGFEKETESV